jgi:hypothetical protein
MIKEIPMNLSYRIFAINPYRPDHFETFCVVTSQLVEAEFHVESLGVKSFIAEDLAGVPDTKLVISALRVDPQERAPQKAWHSLLAATKKSILSNSIYFP